MSSILTEGETCQLQNRASSESKSTPGTQALCYSPCGRVATATGLVAACSILLLAVRWSPWTLAKFTSTRVDYFDDILHSNATCQKTAVFPFRVGCPKECSRAISIDEPMYRMSMAWYFAKPDQPEGIAYDKGVNYQCPKPFVENFRSASSMMTSIQTTSPDLNLALQDRMHVSLSYLCCLRRNETGWAREIMYRWVLENQPFNFQLKFEKVQCWHERHNSVTVIIIADDATQRTLMKLNQDLEHQLLKQKGIATEIHRSQQMPFHMTLFGVYRGAKGNFTGVDFLPPEDDIRPDIPNIYQLVTNVSNHFGNQWLSDQRMHVRHAPYFSATGTLHAGKEIRN